jgi:hypothetical protein
MNEIEISPRAQLGILAVLVAAVAAAVALQMPELKRYLKIRSM